MHLASSTLHSHLVALLRRLRWAPFLSPCAGKRGLDPDRRCAVTNLIVYPDILLDFD